MLDQFLICSIVLSSYENKKTIIFTAVCGFLMAGTSVKQSLFTYLFTQQKSSSSDQFFSRSIYPRQVPEKFYLINLTGWQDSSHFFFLLYEEAKHPLSLNFS